MQPSLQYGRYSLKLRLKPPESAVKGSLEYPQRIRLGSDLADLNAKRSLLPVLVQTH